MTDTSPHSQHHEGTGHHADGRDMAQTLALHDRVVARTQQEIARWLGANSGQRVLDAGCGAGGMTAVLAELGASVEAIDVDDEHVALTRERIGSEPLAARVSVSRGDLTRLPQRDAAAFDLVWCSQVIHHLPDMLAGVRELARVTKPGGTVAICEGSFAFRVLPDDIGLGERWLEDRLAAAGVGRVATVHPAADGGAPYRFGWPQLLADGGLTAIRARTFAFDALSPLTDDEREWVLGHWRRWLTHEELRARLDPADAAVLEQLIDPQSPHYAFARRDLHLRTGLTVYTGRRS